MGKFYWSPTKLNVANSCIMKFYLKYFHPAKPKSLRLSAYVKGSLLHNLIENFWKNNGSEEEVMKKSSKKKYFDAESFAKYSRGKWMSLVIADEKAKDKIHWKNKDEKWYVANSLKDICMPLYDWIINEGPPVFIEESFDFFYGKERFKGRIDEIRLRDNKIVIRDYKSGYPSIKEMRLKHDPQLTIYNVGVVGLIKNNSFVREKLGLGKNLDDFMQGSVYTSPCIEEEFFMIEALYKIEKAENLKNNPSPKRKDFSNQEDFEMAVKIRKNTLDNIPKVMASTKRKDEHFFEVIKMVQGVKKNIFEMNVYPERGGKCDFCDIKYFCDSELEKVGSDFLIGKGGQAFLNFEKPAYLKKETPKELRKKRELMGQLKFRFKYRK